MTMTKPPVPMVGAASRAATVTYPESDGQPMADNTRQFEYIVKIHTGIAAQFREDPNVFIGGDLLWYPVEGDNKTRVAPDVLVAFGRPKGHRGSYMQWQEGGIAPQVVFEVMSPGNSWSEMIRKHRFYDQFGVDEYYLYDPDRGELTGWIRRSPGDRLESIDDMDGWVSPRLNVTLRLVDDELVLTHPDGHRFETAVELEARVETEYRRAEGERRRAEEEQRRADRLAEQLRAMGVEPVD
jgi:Uma2 family endonuclease